MWVGTMQFGGFGFGVLPICVVDLWGLVIFGFGVVWGLVVLWFVIPYGLLMLLGLWAWFEWLNW